MQPMNSGTSSGGAAGIIDSVSVRGRLAPSQPLLVHIRQFDPGGVVLSHTPLC